MPIEGLPQGDIRSIDINNNLKGLIKVDDSTYYLDTFSTKFISVNSCGDLNENNYFIEKIITTTPDVSQKVSTIETAVVVHKDGENSRSVLFPSVDNFTIQQPELVDDAVLYKIFKDININGIEMNGTLIGSINYRFVGHYDTLYVFYDNATVSYGDDTYYMSGSDSESRKFSENGSFLLKDSRSNSFIREFGDYKLENGYIPSENFQGTFARDSISRLYINKNDLALTVHVVTKGYVSMVLLSDGNTVTLGSIIRNYGYSIGDTFIPLSGLTSSAKLNNQNTIIDGSNIWIDLTAGLQNDKPVTGTPEYEKIEWNSEWGETPPSNLNAQMQGFIDSKLWQNGQTIDLLEEELIDPTLYSAATILDLNDNGVIATVVTKKDGTKIAALLLPVEVVELSPKLKDEDGNEIAGSEKPLPLPKRNGMIEEDPYNNRIAHRELKLKIGEALKGKKVTWTMTPFGVEDDDNVRGDWAESQNHKDRFEASADFGANGFNKLSQESGETTIADDGFTAVRVNLPPIGLNQAIIKIKIEGVDDEIEVVKFEVPAVIVVDPGHGSGTGKIDGSNAIGGEADDSKVVEHSFALDVAQKMEAEVRKNDLYKNRNVKVFLTRNTAPNIGMGDRTKVARENGCDTYVSIHFNDSVNRKHRDPFYLVDKTGNLNSADDKALGLRLRQQVETAIAAHETVAGKNSERSQYGPAHWETNLAQGLDTLSDYASATRLGNGNVVGHTPCRAALIEIEWMSHAAADALFNTEAPANEMGKKEAVRSAVAKALSDACIEDIKEYTDE